MMNANDEETDKIIHQAIKKLINQGMIIIPWADDMDAVFKCVPKHYHDLIIKHPNWEEYEVQESVRNGILTELSYRKDIKYKKSGSRPEIIYTEKKFKLMKLLMKIKKN